MSTATTQRTGAQAPGSKLDDAVQAALATAQAADGDHEIAATQRRARAQLQHLSMPDRKVERWKYTSLAPLADVVSWRSVAEAADRHSGSADITDQLADHQHLQSIPGVAWLQVVDGVPSAMLDELAPRGWYLASQSSSSPTAVATPRLADRDEHRDALTLLNDALASHCLTIRANSVSAPTALGIRYQSHSLATAHHSAPRTLITIDHGTAAPAEGSDHILIESFEPADEHALVNAVTEIRLAPGARLHHIRLIGHGSRGRQIARVLVDCEAGSHYQQTALMVGTQLAREETRVTLADAATCQVHGIALVSGRRHLDFALNVDHVGRGTSADTSVHGIATDRGRLIINGRLHIAPNAQQTDAAFNTRNLLLSNTAEINAKPELEIYADDVKCAHGATIGALDEASLFYLRARGIDASAARRLLTAAFVREQLNHAPLTMQISLQAMLNEQIAPLVATA